MDNVVLRALRERRSVREYLPKAVEEEKLTAVLEAGTYAPTGRNRQSPMIVSVENPDDIAALSKLNAAVMGSDRDPFYGAPVVIVVFADPDCLTGEEDAALVLGNLLNAAHAVGLGSCWIHRAREVFASEEGRAFMKKWGVPEQMVGIGHAILGYAANTPAAGPRKENYVRRV